ncbi:alpha/beta fold hydrolase [Streptomyces sp. 549]|uniref:alpha/beta fold hydrolase n=1 Tax=Streptomyces sp. 549 TaxID=3049076 RepID=UPI0032E360D6
MTGPGGRPAGPAPEPGYRMYRAALPEVCARDPRLMVLAGDAGGRCEVFTWNAASGRSRQVTDRPRGTVHGSIDADGWVWWFDEHPPDDDGGGGVHDDGSTCGGPARVDGHGRWRVQEFAGGPHSPGLCGVPLGTPLGLATSAGGRTAVGVGGAAGFSVWLGRRGEAARPVYRSRRPGRLAGLSPCGGLLAVAGAAGSVRAVTVLTSAGQHVTELSGRDGRLWALGFSPSSPQAELLLIAEHQGGYRLACWSRGNGLRLQPWWFRTEISARWYPDARAALVRQDRAGRSSLWTADLDTGTLRPVRTPRGTLLDAAPRPGGDVHYLWTDAVTAPRLCSTAGTPLPGLAELPERVPGHHEDLWTPGPQGPVHTLLSRPDHAPGDVAPLVLLLHGGPADHDRDAYDPMVHSLVASGFAVARANYRGSTGYGPRWRAASADGVGLTQVADLVAVRADLVRRGLARPDAVGLWGTSWGGYLALLALGTQPGLWRAGVAVKPVADSVEAYRTGTPALRALDEQLHGGTPDEVPGRYARSSPLTYAAAVRAPVLVVAGARDTKCPPGQVRRYLAALRTASVPHEELWLDSGHDGYHAEDHVTALRRAVTFLHRHLRDPPQAHPTARPDRGGTPRADRSTALPGRRDDQP